MFDANRKCKYTYVRRVRCHLFAGIVTSGLGRQRSALTALTFAAAVMVGIEPQILWRVSFQLSFLAMAGLVFLFPYLQIWGRKGITNIIGTEGTLVSVCDIIVNSLAVTLAALLVTWPVIAFNFGIVSFVSLPATFFALLALPGIIVTTALVSMIGLFAPFLAQIPELDVVQVVVDPYPTGERKKYEIEMLQMVQQHKPLLLDINFPSFEEADWFLAQLSRRGLCFNARFAPEVFRTAPDGAPESAFWELADR